jgi:hypothetical protein
VSPVNRTTYQWSIHTVTWQTESCQFMEFQVLALKLYSEPCGSEMRRKFNWLKGL